MFGIGKGHQPDYQALWLTEERRKTWEDRLANGVPLLDPQAGEPLSEGNVRLIVVNGQSSYDCQRVAHDLAVLAKRDMGLVYTAWARAESAGQDEPHAFVLAKDGRAIGMIVVRRRRHWEETSWDERLDAVRPSRHEEQRWSTEIIWIARNHRGKGYGRLLINMALYHLETKGPDMAWTLPFSSGGARLIRSVTGDGKLYVA